MQMPQAPVVEEETRKTPVYIKCYCCLQMTRLMGESLCRPCQLKAQKEKQLSESSDSENPRKLQCEECKLWKCAPNKVVCDDCEKGTAKRCKGCMKEIFGESDMCNFCLQCYGLACSRCFKPKGASSECQRCVQKCRDCDQTYVRGNNKVCDSCTKLQKMIRGRSTQSKQKVRKTSAPRI